MHTVRTQDVVSAYHPERQELVYFFLARYILVICALIRMAIVII